MKVADLEMSLGRDILVRHLKWRCRRNGDFDGDFAGDLRYSKTGPRLPEYGGGSVL